MLYCANYVLYTLAYSYEVHIRVVYIHSIYKESLLSCHGGFYCAICVFLCDILHLMYGYAC